MPLLLVTTMALWRSSPEPWGGAPGVDPLAFKALGCAGGGFGGPAVHQGRKGAVHVGIAELGHLSRRGE